MPRNHWTLPMAKRSEYGRLIKQMRAAGADLDPSAFEVEWIDTEYCPAASFVRSSPGATIFGIYLRMLGLAPKTSLQGFELWSQVWDCDAYVLDHPSVRTVLRDPTECWMDRYLTGARSSTIAWAEMEFSAMAT